MSGQRNGSSVNAVPSAGAGAESRVDSRVPDATVARLAIYLRVRAWEAAQRASGRLIHVDLV